MGFQPSKVQKPTLTAPFNGSLAYVFAARRTVGLLCAQDSFRVYDRRPQLSSPVCPANARATPLPPLTGSPNQTPLPPAHCRIWLPSPPSRIPRQSRSPASLQAFATPPLGSTRPRRENNGSGAKFKFRPD